MKVSRFAVNAAGAFALCLPLVFTVPAAADEKADVTTNAGVYTLDTCPVSGAKLGSMGDAVVKTYDGKEVRFCCAGCPAKYEADPAKYDEKIQEGVVKQQKSDYPLETCVVSGQKLGSMGEPVEYVHDNRLVRLCCKGCISAVEKDPAKHLTELDKAAIEKQKADYPLDTCVVRGDELDDNAKDVVIGGQLVRLCCPGCEKKLRAEPQKYLTQIDEARKDSKQG